MALEGGEGGGGWAAREGDSATRASCRRAAGWCRPTEAWQPALHILVAGETEGGDEVQPALTRSVALLARPTTGSAHQHPPGARPCGVKTRRGRSAGEAAIGGASPSSTGKVARGRCPLTKHVGNYLFALGTLEEGDKLLVKGRPQAKGLESTKMSFAQACRGARPVASPTVSAASVRVQRVPCPAQCRRAAVVCSAERKVDVAAVAEKTFNDVVPVPKESTASVHLGERVGGTKCKDSIVTPIVQSATYTFKDTQQLVDFVEGRYESFEYGRYGNPTTRAVEEKLAGMECTDDALMSASGMCSAVTMLLALVPEVCGGLHRPLCPSVRTEQSPWAVVSRVATL
eukprot:scaffold377_cov563-Prasinococcus_capsulatus_cf.AAC.40